MGWGPLPGSDINEPAVQGIYTRALQSVKSISPLFPGPRGGGGVAWLQMAGALQYVEPDLNPNC